MPETVSPETVSLLFYRGSGPFAAIIRWWTKSKFAHVAPCVGDYAYDAYWSTGVTRRDISTSEAFSETDQSAPVVLSGKDATYWQGWLEAQVGKPYDKKAIFLDGLCKRLGGGIHVYDSQQGEWTCSRLATVVAEMTGWALGLPCPPSPQDIYEMVTRT